MNCKYLLLAAVAAWVPLCNSTRVLASTLPVLGSAEDFAVLGHTTVTNTGSTVIFGSTSTLANVGVFNLGTVADASTGFSASGNTFVGPGTNTDGPGVVSAPAAVHLGSPAAGLARNDLIVAYAALGSYGTATNLTGHDLGTSGTLPLGTLAPGVYSFATTAQLNGALKLDAGGLDGGVWIFEIGTTLTTASASAVQLINPGGKLGSDVGVFWLVGSSATLGTTTAFEGNILAQTSITLDTGATLYNGRALAENGAVTLDSNIISDICPPASFAPNSGPGFSGGVGFDSISGKLVPVEQVTVPEPATSALAAGGAAVFLARRIRRRPQTQRICI
ncbi:MAG: ice-binding family protein [Tepidisphaeraceae bacterium]|jgi:type VI secretion system secreted protein VgrG